LSHLVDSAPSLLDRLRQHAIKQLARREHSRAELARKLLAIASDSPDVAEDIATVLDQLEQSGLLSDTRYVEAYLRSHAARFGAARLRNTLRTKGIAAELIESALAQMAAIDESGEEMNNEMARAKAVWWSKFGSRPRDAREWARQARFLQSRGFASEVICKVIKAEGNGVTDGPGQNG